MIDHAYISLTPVAPTAPAAHPGLLYTSGQDFASWVLYALLAVAAFWLMPGQVRESVKALYSPVGRWIRGLAAPLAVSLWSWMVLCVLGPILCLLGAFLAFRAVLGSTQELREGFNGFLVPRKV